ncbi:MAG TPA: flagellar FlbD family protein [Planctomycetaceae bacterium]|jgi:flagellar protein FlbD
MIKLTRLSGEEFILNAELIRFVESHPDTHIILTTNERFMVREPMDEVVRRAIDYARQVRIIPAA